VVRIHFNRTYRKTINVYYNLDEGKERHKEKVKVNKERRKILLFCKKKRLMSNCGLIPSPIFSSAFTI